MLEYYLNGVSTPTVINVVKSPGMENVSALYVSLLTLEKDANIKLLLERSIESLMKSIYTDATNLKLKGGKL